MNGNNLNTKFEELFRDFSEEPSSNCWNAISQKLDVVMPASASATAAQSASGFSKFIASTVGKTIVAFTGVSLVGVALVAVLNTSTPEKIEKKDAQSSQIAQIKNVVTEKQESLPTSKRNIENSQNTPLAQTEILPSSNVNVVTPFVADNNKEIKVNSEPIRMDVTTPKVVESTKPIKEESTSVTEEIVENSATPPVTSTNTPIAKKPSSLNLVFPNVFTPNGDGFNDLFEIKNLENASNNRLVVINANGLKVFEANNYQNNWDASNAPDGAYYYVFETKVEGVPQTFYGAIQILR